jgi:hypothetical protein
MFAELPPQRKTFVKIWVIVIAAIYLLLGVGSVSIVEGEKLASGRNHELRMTPGAVEPGKTPPNAIPATGDFVNVKVGIYLDSIENFSIRDSFWTTTFYVWFTWQGDKTLDPGKTFQLVDAKIDKKELLENYTGADGVNYQRYRIAARITKFFNTTRVPLDDHMLNIYIEDGARDATRLRYVVDPASNMSSRAQVPGYKITGFSNVVKSHTYKTTYGDPRVTDASGTTFTEYIYAVTLKRNGFGIFFKLFTGLFAGVLLTLGSFFIRPSDTGPRFGLPSAAYFGAVANTYLVSSIMPSAGQFGLADCVTIIGLLTIFVCIVASLTSAYFFLKRDEKELSRHLDRVSWITIGVGYLLINIALPWFAFS